MKLDFSSAKVLCSGYEHDVHSFNGTIYASVEVDGKAYDLEFECDYDTICEDYPGFIDELIIESINGVRLDGEYIDAENISDELIDELAA